VNLPDIVSRGKPTRFDLPSRQPWPLAEMFGRYELLEQIPSGPDDQCYWSRIRGPAGFERIVFLRRFAGARLDDGELVEALKRQAYVNMRGVSQVFEFGRVGEWGFVVGEIVAGASVAALARGLKRVSWLVALAIVFDACARLAAVHERYGQDVELAVTPARIMLSTAGEVTLCTGLPRRQRAPWHRTVCEIIQPILSLAADDDAERAMLRELFTDDNPMRCGSRAMRSSSSIRSSTRCCRWCFCHSPGACRRRPRTRPSWSASPSTSCGCSGISSSMRPLVGASIWGCSRTDSRSG